MDLSDDRLREIEESARRCVPDNLICAKQDLLDLVSEVRRLKAQLSPPSNPYDGFPNYC